jgi:hypothetical protein
MYILFTTIYLLHEQKLNASNYSKQEINMEILVWANYHDMNIHAKIQSISKYRYL